MTGNGNRKKAKAKAYSADVIALRLVGGMTLIALGCIIFLAVDLNVAGENGIFIGLKDICYGIAGRLTPILAIFPAWGGILLAISAQRRAPERPFVFACLAFLFLCTFMTATETTGKPIESLMEYLSHSVPRDDFGGYLYEGYQKGVKLFSQHGGGGVIGMLLGWPLWRLFNSPVLCAILAMLGLIAMVLLAFSLTPSRIQAFLTGKGIALRRNRRQAMNEQDQRQMEMQREEAIRQHQAYYAAQQEYARQQQEYARQQQEYAMRQEQERIAREQTARQTAAARQTAQPTYPVQPAQPDPGTTYRRHIFEDTADISPKEEKAGFLSKIFRKNQNDGLTDPESIGNRGQHAGAEKRECPRPEQRPAESRMTEPENHAYPRPEQRPEGNPVEETRQPAARGEDRNRGRVWDEQEDELIAFNGRERQRTENDEECSVRVRPRPVENEGRPVLSDESGKSETVWQKQIRTAMKEMEQARPTVGEYPEKETDESQREPPLSSEQPIAHQSELQPDRRPDFQPVSEAELQPENHTNEARRASAGFIDMTIPKIKNDGPEGGWKPELKLQPRKETTEDSEKSSEPEEPPYVFPPIDLISPPKQEHLDTSAEDAMRARILEETLESFRVRAKVVNVTHGPAISRFELQLEAGIKVNKITELVNDIAMNMEATSVRIEAPIPGKSLVGVEVPNRKVTPVTLREVLESEPMRTAKSSLSVALGKDIAGTPIICDLARMPHLLIAGATGSGKSVCINTIINSLLYRCTPEDVRLILVDPKVVELQCYNKVPHLLVPVVNDPHKAAAALAWAVAEMMSRYDRFAERMVRNIDGFNANLEPGEKRMPRIVIIIDELADLMMVCKKDVEDYICRLTQLARAAGIHLIVATQRPSVDVITGLIKANIPSRIAFKTASAIDSRTILDKNGSEQLLGWGDMLYLPTGAFMPTRIQGCFLSDGEVSKITDYIAETCPRIADPDILEKMDEFYKNQDNPSADMIGGMPQDDGGSDSGLLEQCIEMTVQEGQISTSTIQRRLKIGYARAGRLTDEMEARGIVSAKDGSKPRKCLITREEWEQMKRNTQEDDG